MYVFGGGHASTMTDAVQSFDLQDTLEWSDLYEPTPCMDMVEGNVDTALGAWIDGPAGPYPRPVSAHTYDLVGVVPELDEFVLVGRAFTQGYCSSASNDIGGPVAHYDLAGNAWEFSADASSGGFSNGLPGAERDPVSGYFIAISEYGLVAYDPLSRTIVADDPTLETSGGETFDQAAALGYANHMVYFPPDDRMYYFARGSGAVYAVTLDRDDLSATTVDLVDASGPTSPHQEPGYDYDAHNAIIGGGVTDGVFYAFDPATATWTAENMQGGDPGTQAFHAIAYSPVDNVFVFRTTNETWAYRYRN